MVPQEMVTVAPSAGRSGSRADSSANGQVTVHVWSLDVWRGWVTFVKDVPLRTIGEELR
ncbi:hypothetical protein [Actinoallomurus sp. CA-150999]|uniref:hypothetical protein n=1 Tax=Actinoallomurus sp. CA-150999 TaxID=3239887 RepID=UPI003D90BA1E